MLPRPLKHSQSAHAARLGVGRRFHARLFLVCTLCLLIQTAQGSPSPLRLWYRQPATKWTEALPVGNGRLGAMIFGGVEHERLQLNENSVWSGTPKNYDRRGGYSQLPEIRRLLFANHPDQADALLRRELVSATISGSYQPLGDLELLFSQPSVATHYERELDLNRAIVTTRYRAGSTEFTREVWCSEPDQVLVIRITASAPKMISFTAKLRRENAATVTPTDNVVELSGQTDRGLPTAGVSFVARLQVNAQGGHVERRGDNLHVSAADEVILLLAANTDYVYVTPAEKCTTQLARAAARSPDELKSRHLADYQNLFARVSLSLGESADDKPTDQRLATVRTGTPDAALVALFFHYGRYLLISSSRGRGLPANLQGLWNDSFSPPWYGGWHFDINLEMNYWLAEPAALPECHAPLFHFLDRLRANGRQSARDVYGARGFVLSHRTNAWLFTSPNLGLPVWPTASAWLCEHLWEHYLFTGNREFLRATAFPIMQEAAEFFLDWLVENPDTGKLVSGPSLSPENTYWFRDKNYTRLDMGPAMDQQLITALFDHCLAAADLLEVSNEVMHRIREVRPRLAGPQIGRDGRLLEWSREFPEREPEHRHVSHLWAVFPGTQISRRNSPELAKAARASLLARNEPAVVSSINLSRQDNVGWSLAWNAAIWSRLGDASRAHQALTGIFERTLFPNLMSSHPRPNQENVFQIDANFGSAAAIAEMLLQSHDNEIELLPALPDDWHEGSFRGLRARGGFSVDATWQHDRLTNAAITATQTTHCRVRSAQRFRVFLNETEVAVSEPAGDSHRATFSTDGGKTYRISPQNPEPGTP